VLQQSNARHIRARASFEEARLGLVQAQEREARFFIVDERRARDIGEKQGLVLVGTLRLLARLSLEGHSEDTRLLVRRLRKERGFRVVDDIVEKAIEDAIVPI